MLKYGIRLTKGENKVARERKCKQPYMSHQMVPKQRSEGKNVGWDEEDTWRHINWNLNTYQQRVDHTPQGALNTNIVRNCNDRQPVLSISDNGKYRQAKNPL